MNLVPLGLRLEANGAGKIRESIFINMIPIRVNNGILLRNPLVGTAIDYEMKGYYRTEFQVIVRAANYESGESLMQKVFQILTLEETQVGDMHIKHCYPRFEPVVYPISDGNLLEFSTDFNIAFYKV